MSNTCLNFQNPTFFPIFTQILFYQNDLEWPKMDFKHNFETPPQWWKISFFLMKASLNKNHFKKLFQVSIEKY